MTVEELVLWLCRWVLPIVVVVVFWLGVGAVLSVFEKIMRTAIKQRRTK